MYVLMQKLVLARFLKVISESEFRKKAYEETGYEFISSLQEQDF